MFWLKPTINKEWIFGHFCTICEQIIKDDKKLTLYKNIKCCGQWFGQGKQAQLRMNPYSRKGLLKCLITKKNSKYLVPTDDLNTALNGKRSSLIIYKVGCPIMIWHGPKQQRSYLKNLKTLGEDSTYSLSSRSCTFYLLYRPFSWICSSNRWKDENYTIYIIL